MTWLKSSVWYVGFFLAQRDIKRSNPWTTALIVFVMTLTFLNMILLGGVLNGLATGMAESFNRYYSGDVFISPAIHKNTIEQTDAIANVVTTLPTFKDKSVRFTGQAIVEYEYRKIIRTTDVPESVSGTLVGIDPVSEDNVTKLSDNVIEGSFLTPQDADGLLLGKDLLEQYSNTTFPGQKKLTTVKTGSRVRVTTNGVQKEFVVKGIIGAKNQTVDGRIYVIDTTARELLGRNNLNANEIAVRLQPNASADDAEKYITSNLGNNNDVEVQTSAETIPGGVADIRKTFNLLGNMVGGIALIVGAITIFIVIFVNAITRRKFIGILKGTGISANAIELSYIFQSLFYALSGIVIASLLIMGIIKPYLAIHPLQFPVTEGQLDVTVFNIFVRGVILTFVALISGFIPAWLVTKQNTLDAILGR